MPAIVRQPSGDISIRAAAAGDVPALIGLERRAFSYDVMARRSFRRLVGSETAALVVAERNGVFAGYALVLFRARSRVARLYSIAVAADHAGRGVGPARLAAAEAAARDRGADLLRLEVHEHNAAAINRYRKAGYACFGTRLAYYDDGATALRYEKRLSPSFTGDEGSSSTCNPPAS